MGGGSTRVAQLAVAVSAHTARVVVRVFRVHKRVALHLLRQAGTIRARDLCNEHATWCDASWDFHRVALAVAIGGLYAGAWRLVLHQGSTQNKHKRARRHRVKRVGKSAI